MVGFSRGTDIALSILSALARRGEGYTSLRALARERHLPYQFSSQVCGLLVRAGIVEAREGVHGGYRLAKDPGAISVADVVRAAEGGVALTACLDARKHCACPQKRWCTAKEGMTMLQGHLERLFGRVTLAEFLSEHRAHARHAA